MSGLVVEEVRDVAALESRSDEWRALVEDDPDAEIFETWEWVHAWLRCFWAGRPLAFLLVRDGTRLVGIVPLLDDAAGILGCRGALTLPLNAHVRRMDVISTMPRPDLLRAALQHLRATRGGAVRLAFRDIPAGSAPPALVATAAQLGLATLSLESFPSPVVRIASTFDDYLATRTPKVRHELRRKTRNAETRLGWTWSVLGAPEECGRALQAILAIERRSWKEEAGTSFTAEPGLEPFYTEVATSFARAGWLRAFLLSTGETPVAHILGATYRRRYYALKTSYDEAFRAASPGVVLFHHALRDAFERGLETFDFLGNPAPWKMDLANGVRRHVRCCAFPRLDPRCRLCEIREGQLRPLAHRLKEAATSTAARLGAR